METTQATKWTVIKLGGSILIPDLPDHEYLKLFRALIRERIEMGEKFLIIVGGGKTCRNYQAALRAFDDVPEVSQDWIGIKSGNFNGELVRLSFGEQAYKEVVVRIDDLPENKENYDIIMCGGEKPGHSFNYDGVIFGNAVGAKTLINISNIDYVYNSDPKENPDAEKYPEVSWEQYRTFIPKEWTPGLSVPFDPPSSELAQELDMEVVFMKGNPIDNLRKYLETGEVEGTVISNKFA